jgi:serine/threonine protein phosphatase PrpC
MIKVKKQYTVSELGKRNNNEDNFGYVHGTTFVVCDGVGGSNMGEVASELTVKTFIDAFNKNPNADASDVLKLAEFNISDHIVKHPNLEGMATTLTFSQIKDNGVYLVWVGDSRIYQFRGGEIIFQTTDHSWVNEALRSGIITPSEAINHPKSNIITRAIQGSQKPTKVDSCLLTNIKKGDIFLHCTDGVLESWTNEDLSALFLSLKEPEAIIAKIRLECLQNSKDNFTAIIYQIEDTNLANTNKVTPLNVFDTIPTKGSMNNTFPISPIPQKSSKNKKFVILASLVVLAIIPTTIFLTSLYFNDKENETDKIKNESGLRKETNKPNPDALQNNSAKEQTKSSTISPTSTESNLPATNLPNINETISDGKTSQTVPRKEKTDNNGNSQKQDPAEKNIKKSTKPKIIFSGKKVKEEAI